MYENNEVGETAADETAGNEAADSETVGKWITRRDAADLADRSIDTIRRAEKKHEFTERYDATTKEKLLSVVELVRYGVIDPCQATVPESSMTRSRVERDNSDLRSKLAQLNAVNERLQDEIAFLRDALMGRAA